MSRFLDTLAERVIIYDGAMGTNIQSYQLSAEDYGGQATEGCNEYLVLTKPAVIEENHAGFLEGGCEDIETDSFTASRLKLDEKTRVNLFDRSEEHTSELQSRSDIVCRP